MGANIYFSKQAKSYATSRPGYPAPLIEFLGQLPVCKHLAIDCATGNGQAAVDLAKYFDHVIATDISEQQLKEAYPANNVRYFCAEAESIPAQDACADLITVAQAWHWLSPTDFELEAQRVLKPGGFLAVWGYNLLSVNEDIDALIKHYYQEILTEYWPEERKVLENGYSKFPYLLKPLPAPTFTMTDCWSLARMIQYLYSWSATQRLIEDCGDSTIKEIEKSLTKLWGLPSACKDVYWPVVLKVAKKI